jgi:hypothetical protein
MNGPSPGSEGGPSPRLRPVAHLINKIKDQATRDYIDLKRYSVAFADYPILGTQVLNSGFYGIFVHLENDQVLVLPQSGYRLDPSAWGRSFDVPVLDHGFYNDCAWLLQPYSSPGLSEQQFFDFVGRLIYMGYAITGGGRQVCGIYDGEPRLRFPWLTVYKPTKFAAPHLRPGTPPIIES